MCPILLSFIFRYLKSTLGNIVLINTFRKDECENSRDTEVQPPSTVHSLSSASSAYQETHVCNHYIRHFYCQTCNIRHTLVGNRASQNPIRRMRASDLGSSLSLFKKAADTEFSYEIMYVCTAAQKIFVMSWWAIKLLITQM